MYKIKKETGITLIALVVTIIILVIIAAVSIRALTGEDGIIASSQTSAKNYTIAEYQETIEQGVEQTILEQAILRNRSNIRHFKNKSCEFKYKFSNYNNGR